MASQNKFFRVAKRETDSGRHVVDVSAGTVEIWPGGSQGSGDIWISLDPARSSRSHQVGVLFLPERATLTFRGTIEQMRALWMKVGTKHKFLKDGRFAFSRL